VHSLAFRQWRSAPAASVPPGIRDTAKEKSTAVVAWCPGAAGTKVLRPSPDYQPQPQSGVSILTWSRRVR